jgi:exodeoxyribonuclease VII large subunit
LQKETPEIYSVSRLNREARQVLESRYGAVWVEGEISNFKFHTSGHMYFTLKDETAQISAVFFSRFNQAVRFELKDGLKVLAFGKISLYEPRGQYQLSIERVEPRGVGALQLAFLQMKEKLEKEGLFDPARKKPIPVYPRTVGIVTSPTGAAIRDILNIISRRFHGTPVLLYPVKVQGEGAAAEIAEAVRHMNTVEDIDVLIVGRGGGSLEDLWAFNEESVARAVYASSIPVISAVGHEIDWTICDLVADLRAPTPSAAAELVVRSRDELEERIRELGERMRNAVRHVLDGWQETLGQLEASYAFRQPAVLIQQFSQRLDEVVRDLQQAFKAAVTAKKQEFRKVVGQLEALSPLGILARGYSLTYREGVLVKKFGQLKKGDIVRTRLAGGQFDSQVTGLRPGGKM